MLGKYRVVVQVKKGGKYEGSKVSFLLSNIGNCDVVLQNFCIDSCEDIQVSNKGKYITARIGFFSRNDGK